MRIRTHTTFAGTALVCLYPAALAVSLTSRFLAGEHHWLEPIVAVFCWILVIRGARAGVRVLPASVVVRGLWWTHSVPIGQVRQVNLSNSAAPMAIGGGFIFNDHGLVLDRKDGRRIKCPSVYGRKAPGVVKSVHREIQQRRAALAAN